MTKAAAQIFLVSKDPPLLALLSEALRTDDIAIRLIGSGDELFETVRLQSADLILLDADEMELLRELKEVPATLTVPTMMFIGAESVAEKKQAFELGAHDCLSCQIEAAELRARVYGALQLKRRFDEMLHHQRDLMGARIAAESAARAKSDFLAAMSHEIRTPMNGVVAMVGLLLETQLTSEQRGYLETIQASSEALLTIINDILDFSKIEAGKLELDLRSFDLRQCVEETLDLMAPKAFEKNLDLIYRMDEGVPAQVEGDALRLRQVLVNLLSNAIKFTKTGEILVQTKLLSVKNEQKENLLHLHFSVADTGIGIPPDRLVRLFKPFSQAEASTAHHYGGTGLGLAISKQLVELMGGKMWAESVAGEGSAFHFTINAVAQAKSAPFALAGSQMPLSGKRVLIVDDNAASRRALSDQTTKWGMIPQIAADGRQAMSFLRESSLFDLVILDAQLPDNDGIALASEIHQLPRKASLPLVLLTPLGSRQELPSAGPVPFTTFAVKPVKPGPFFAALTRALSKSTPQTPQPPVEVHQTTPVRHPPLRLLLCDDNSINQKVAARIVQQLGYEPDLVTNGREALEALYRKSYDLIFMDVMMPEMDGLEATRAIRDLQQKGEHKNFKSRIVIVAMTAQAMQGDREKCLEAGMDDYLAKPIRPKDVRAVIDRWSSQFNRPAEAPPSAVSATGNASSNGEESPVEMERLLDLGGGDAQSLRELVELYFQQTTGQLAQLEAALRANQPETVRQVAHSCAGASATLGMKHLVPVLRELERQGKAGQLVNGEKLHADALREFKRTQDFLAKHPALALEATAQS